MDAMMGLNRTTTDHTEAVMYRNPYDGTTEDERAQDAAAEEFEARGYYTAPKVRNSMPYPFAR